MNIVVNDSVKDEEKVEEKVILTDEEVDKVVSTIEDLKSNDSKFIESLPSNNGVEEAAPQELELIEEEVQEVYDGNHKYFIPKDSINYGDKKDSLDKLLDMDEEEIKKSVDISISNEKIIESLQPVIPGIDSDDIVSFLKVLERYRKGEKISYYQELSESFKNKIDSTLGSNVGKGVKRNDVRNYLITNLFDQIIQDNYFETAFIDLDKAISREMEEATEGIKKDFTSYNLNNRAIVEKLPLQAEKIKETNPEQADKLLSFVDNFKEAYTYNKFIEAINKGKCRSKTIEIEKIERLLRDFNNRYKDTKFTIQAVETIYPVLLDKLGDEYSEEYIRRFLIAFIKYSNKLDNTKLNDHVFMYYFIKNIDNMVFYDETNEEDSKFYEDLLNTIRTAINAIKRIEDDIDNKRSKK